MVLLTAGIGLSSCKKDFLSTSPLGQVSANDVWADGALAEAFVNGTYSGLGMGGFNEEMLASLTDEAVFTHAGRGYNIINEGNLNQDNRGWTNNTFEWGAMYRAIRATNLALENLEVATFTDENLKDRLKGEAHFLRAYYYQQLLRFYGGVPIVNRSYGLGEDYALERSSYADCVDFIVADCDTAADLLDGKNMQKGRASKLAAMALKSRVLLYAASDLHDIPTAKANSSLISGYAKPELLGYVSGDRNARWQAARDAAKAVIDLGSGYKLDLNAPVSPQQGKLNYLSIAMGGGSKSTEADPAAAVELIFTRNYIPEKDEFAGQNVGLSNGPNGYHNWAGNTPVQQLVDDYEMMDGTKFSWSNADQKADPYADRDPRFYASILYDGADWKPRDKISGNVDPANQIQVGVYNGVFGLDTRQSSIENWNGSWTGYYMRKFIDPNPDIVDNNTDQYIPWPFLRYTEAVFNYIEASFELGDEITAREWLNKIRFRSGMPAVADAGAALETRYRNERRIEMAYEEQRYHDARRWMIAPQTLGRKLVYIRVVGTLKPGASMPVPYRKSTNALNYTYSPVEDNSLENRTWVDKMYFLPILRDEVNKNEKLDQNPGYDQ